MANSWSTCSAGMMYDSKMRCIVTIGLGFGDEGKGSIVDFLCREFSASSVVRYNGGPQAAHHVVRANGIWHCFSQFGSGTFSPGVRTHLSSNMLIKPSNMLVERDVLEGKGQGDVMERTTMDPGACLVTPWHGILCRLQETARGSGRLGSVGMGVGLAAADKEARNSVLTLRDLGSNVLREKFRNHVEEKMELAWKLVEEDRTGQLMKFFDEQSREIDAAAILYFYEEFARKYADCFREDRAALAETAGKDSTIVLEGAQGILLDVRHGFSPHVTKTDVTLSSAGAILGTLPPDASVIRIGILRAYSSRHGAGPFVSFDPKLTDMLPEHHNRTNAWQGAFRLGFFDLVMAKYALSIPPGVDSLALTCVDRLSGRPHVRVCCGYEYQGNRKDIESFFEVENAGGKAIITGIKNQGDLQKQKELTKVLFECKPSVFREFKGWGRIEPGKGWESLPSPLKEFVSFLESDEALSTPVSIVSAGPNCMGKILRADKMLLRK